MCHHSSHVHVGRWYGGGRHHRGFGRHHRFGGSHWGHHRHYGIYQGDYEQAYVAPTRSRAPVRAAPAAPPPQEYGVVLQQAPARDVAISDDPPPYTKSAMETSDVPASVRTLNASQSQDPVPLETLGKESAYIICPKCHHESFTRTKTVPRSKAVYVPVAVCYGTGVLAPLACMYLNKYGDKVHRCGVCGNELAKWRSADGVVMIKEAN